MRAKTAQRRLALRLQKPVANYLKSRGVIFGQHPPGMEWIAAELKKLHPEIGANTPKRRALVIFSEMFPDRIKFVRPPTIAAALKRKQSRVQFQKSKTEFDAFYISKPWRVLRYKALKKYGPKCQCCGGTAESTGKPLHVDHVKPRSKFPHLELELSNLQILCHDCNLGKGGWDETDWRDPLVVEFKAVIG